MKVGDRVKMGVHIGQQPPAVGRSGPPVCGSGRLQAWIWVWVKARARVRVRFGLILRVEVRVEVDVQTGILPL